MTKEFLASVTKTTESDHIQSAIDALNNDTFGLYVQAMHDFAKAYQPVIACEVHEAVRKRLPYFTVLDLTVDQMTKHIPPVDCGTLTDDKMWAYQMKDHGYLPQRFAHEIDSSSDDSLKIYRIGHSYDWYCGPAIMTSEFLNNIVQSYINGFIKKICSDAELVALTAAFHKNSVIVGENLADCLHNIMMYDIRDNNNIQSLTDIYVGDEVFLGLQNTADTQIVNPNKDSLWYTVNHGRVGEQTYTIHRASNINIGQPWSQFLTLKPDQGGLGLVRPENTHSLIFGVNSHNSERMQLWKGDIGFYPACDQHRAQTLGFYGWMNMACRVLDNKYVQLGAVRSAR